LHCITKYLLHPLVIRKSANGFLPILGVAILARVYGVAQRGDLDFKAFDAVFKTWHVYLLRAGELRLVTNSSLAFDTDQGGGVGPMEGSSAPGLDIDSQVPLVPGPQ
jgi:hypothetical protein